MKDEEKRYIPELGQMAFGCPTSEFPAPRFIEAGLILLSEEIERVEWNRTQKQFDSPTGNNGGEYLTPVFQMYSYYWGEDEKLQNRPNFKCGDFEVRWYKYLGRGMSINKTINAREFFQIIDKCMDYLEEQDKKELGE